MVRTVTDFRNALQKIQAIHDEIWTKENFQIELTRALTTIENARMEWNSAQLELPAARRRDCAKSREVETAPAPAVSHLRA